MNSVIQIQGLSKKYRIGQPKGYQTLRESISSFVKNPINAFGNLDNSGDQLGKDEFWALKNISLKVNQGEVVGIIGQNGSGKSTLLKILSRITPPTTGTVTIRGKVASLLEVGTGFSPELTGRENIFLNGAILGMKQKEIKKKFDEIVAFSGVEKFIDTPVKHYSSGMYVRLAFAVASHLSSEILLVDEVLAVGDSAFQQKCLGKMRDVVAGGRTILFISHSMAAIADLCERVVLIKNGRIEKIGDVRKVVDHYLSTGKNQNPVILTSANHLGSRKHVLIQKLSVLNNKDKYTTSFLMGETIVAEIKIKCSKNLPNAEVGLKISSSTGVALHYFVSSWEGLKINLAQHKTYIFKVAIPRIMLLPGRYVLGVWVTEDGQWSDDNVQSALSIEILSYDITGNIKSLGLKSDFNKYAVSGCETYAYSKWEIYGNNR